MLQSLKGAAHGGFISSVNHNTCQALRKQKGLSTLLLLLGIWEGWGWSRWLLSRSATLPGTVGEGDSAKTAELGCEESTANPAELTAQPLLPNRELSPCACREKSAAARLNNSIH